MDRITLTDSDGEGIICAVYTGICEKLLSCRNIGSGGDEISDKGAEGLRGGMTAFDTSLTLLLDFEQYENDPYIRTLMRDACHRGLYALVNSAAMNGVGPNTEISRIVFWPASLSFVLAIVFWGLSIYCAVRWYRRHKVWKAEKQPRTGHENLHPEGTNSH